MNRGIDKDNVVSSLTKGLFINNFNLQNKRYLFKYNQTGNANAPLQVNFKELISTRTASFVEVRIYNLVENQWNGRNKKFKHITLHF
jgi:hypothetical protein